MEFASGYIYIPGSTHGTAPSVEQDKARIPPPVPKRCPRTARTVFYDPAEGSDQIQYDNVFHSASQPPLDDSSKKYDNRLPQDFAGVLYDEAEGRTPVYETTGIMLSNSTPVYDIPESSASGCASNATSGGRLYPSLSDIHGLSQSASMNSNPPTYYGDRPCTPSAPAGIQGSPNYVEALPHAASCPTEKRPSIPEGVAQTQTSKSPKPPPLPQRTHLKPMLLKSNVNVALVNAGKLADITTGNVNTGTPVFCHKCTAAMSGLSQVDAQETTMWTCEFCGSVTSVDYRCTTSDLGDDQLYLHSSHTDSTQDPNNSLVVFCIDISGSMSVTSEVPGNGNTKSMHMSRLQAVKAAVSQSLHYLRQKDPTKRVALVTFNDEVKIYGDGLTYPLSFRDFELIDEDYLKSQGQQLPAPRCIVDSMAALEDQIFRLQEKGATALGPAALISVAMASKKAGSKVIICTDGKANTDLGNLEDFEEDEIYQSSMRFYSSVAEYAVQHGVIVSVLTIEGTDCRLAELGQMADRTGGKVNIVDPKVLSSEFQSILEDDVIATKVMLKFLVDKDMYFKYEDHTDHVLEKHIGNVTKDTELTFEFGIQESSLQEAAGKSQLPFQIQLNFTLPDGRSGCRLLSQQRPVTGNSSLVENSMNISVLQIHCSQLSARLAMEGRMDEAKQEALAQMELIQQILGKTVDKEQEAIYEDWVKSMSPIYQDLPSSSQTDTLNEPIYETAGQSAKTSRKNFSDEVANVIFRLKNAKKKMFKKNKFVNI